MGDRCIRSINPILTRINRAKAKRQHRNNIRNMKSSVDTACPKSLTKGRRRNRKKEQLQEDRFALIERENRILLEKMSQIMLRSSLDMAGDRSHVHSLNLPQRKRDIKRINSDNRILLERIEKTQPYYNRKKWMRDRRKHLHTLKTMGEFPFSLGLSNKARAKVVADEIRKRSNSVRYQLRPKTSAGLRAQSRSHAGPGSPHGGMHKRRSKSISGRGGKAPPALAAGESLMSRARSSPKLTPIEPPRGRAGATGTSGGSRPGSRAGSSGARKHSSSAFVDGPLLDNVTQGGAVAEEAAMVGAPTSVVHGSTLDL